MMNTCSLNTSEVEIRGWLRLIIKTKTGQRHSVYHCLRERPLFRSFEYLL